MSDAPIITESSPRRRDAAHKPAADEQWLASFMQQLEGEFRTLVPPYLNTQAASLVQTILAKPLDSVGWADAYNVETALIELCPRTRIAAWGPSLLAEYFDFTGTAHPLASQLLDVAKLDDISLRSNLAQISSDLHWLYTTVYLQEFQRGQLTKRLVSIMGVWFVVSMAFGLIVTYGFHWNVPLLLLVVFAGSVGGFISTEQRIQRVPTNGNPINNIYALDRGWFSVYLAPLSGAIFAVLLLLIFMAGLIGNGSLTPAFATPDNSGSSFSTYDFFVNSSPLGGVNYAKVLVWSFIAGFAERLVPDTIDRIVAANDKA